MGFYLAVYICKCGFSFERLGDADQCPDCGGRNVRFATDSEAAEHRRNREESDRAYSQEKNEACV
jgi:rRNA maturation endonuclease Nob1